MRLETGDFLIWGGPKTDKTWDFLLRHEIFSWDRRQEIFSFGGPKLKRHNIFSWDMRFSHETGDRRYHRWGGAKTEIFSWDIRFFHETGHFLIQPPHKKISCILSHEKIPCLMRFSFGIYRESMRHDIFSWERRFSHGGVPRRKYPISCLMRKSLVSRENLMSYQFLPPP